MQEVKKHYAREVWFKNGFGLSIVSHKDSYGGYKGLFEIALLHRSDKERLFYGPSWEDVRGYLDFADVARVMEEVRDYPEDRPIGDMGGPYHPAEQMEHAGDCQ
jgi:hypothetical protein